MKLVTSGYEGATQDDVIGRLQRAGVELVVDVRAVAASRRAGFSKTLLANSLQDAGIGYRHLRALGAPKAGREAARKGRIDEMRAIFADHLAKPDAQHQLDGTLRSHQGQYKKSPASRRSAGQKPDNGLPDDRVRLIAELD